MYFDEVSKLQETNKNSKITEMFQKYYFRYICKYVFSFICRIILTIPANISKQNIKIRIVTPANEDDFHTITLSYKVPRNNKTAEEND